MNRNFWALATIMTILVGVWLQAITVWPAKIYPQHTHKTVYVDRNLNDDEFQMIAQAAIRWSFTTNHIIDYDVIRMPIFDHQEIADPDKSIVIIAVSPEYPDIIQTDTRNSNSTLGLYKDHWTSIPVIELVVERIDNSEFEAVVMHEMGHSIGLSHSKDEDTNTLMYPNINLGADYITRIDMESFCKLYGCDAIKLGNEKKTSHL